jgi:hypothetical protein
VRRRVTIVGRPLGMPTIDGHNSTRLFMVEGTGALDLRFIRLIKVGGEGGAYDNTRKASWACRCPASNTHTHIHRRGDSSKFCGMWNTT